MRTLVYLSFSLFIILFSSCNTDKTLIKKELNKRYTAFEIVNIIPDSANVKEAAFLYISIGVKAAKNSTTILEALIEAENNFNDLDILKAKYHIIDSLDEDLLKYCERFENLYYNRNEKVYFVEYSIAKDGINKTNVKEYFHINRNTDEVITRPVDWKEYLEKIKYDEIIDKSIQYTVRIMRLEMQIKNLEKYNGKLIF